MLKHINAYFHYINYNIMPEQHGFPFFDIFGNLVAKRQFSVLFFKIIEQHHVLNLFYSDLFCLKDFKIRVFRTC